MKRTIGIIIVLLMLMSVTCAWAGMDRNTRPDTTTDGLDLQIFEKELNVHGEENFVSDEILVKFKSGVVREKINKINSKHGASVRYTSPYTGIKRVAIPEGKTVAEMVKLYQAEGAVEYAGPNHICRASFVPNDTYYNTHQWNFNLINMSSAWDLQLGGNPGIVVAVLDTGVAYEDYTEYIPGPGRSTMSLTYVQVPDLAGTSFVGGYDFINNDSHPNDDNAHGTHVTGTIAQTTDNGYGVAGMAFKTSIMPVKVLGKDGSGTDIDLADGICYAADNGADVISMSLGFSQSVTNIPAVAYAVAYAHNKKVVLVASSGNEGVGVVSLPAAYPEVIAVGAVHSGDVRAIYSQYGNALDVVAPGGDVTDHDGDGFEDYIVQQTFREGYPTDFGLWGYTGTSMAAPHVSGLIALLLAQDSNRTQGEIRNILYNTSVDLGDSGWDVEYGYGRIDAFAALSYDAVQNTPPMANAGGPYPGMEDASITFVGSASDGDGDSLTYKWDFGDGTQVTVTTNNTTTHTYTTGKADETTDYNVTLIVSDGKEDSNPSTTTTLVEGVNDAPVADAGGSYSGIVNDTITFDGSGSSDEEGTIINYTWNFGDGSCGTGETVTHIYTTKGTYTVTLTVTDGDEATDTATTTAEVTEASTNTIHVHSIDMWNTNTGRNHFIYTMVVIRDSEEAPVSEATVTLETTLPDSSIISDSGSTNSDGTVTFKLRSRQTGTYGSKVIDVVKTDWGYDQSKKAETDDSIII